MNEFPWLKNYPTDVNSKIDLNKYSSLVHLLEDSFAKYAELDAFLCMGRSFTYKEIDTLSGEFAAYLQNFTSLKPGDRIAIQMPNLLQYPVVMFGALRAGLIVVNTNPLYTEREMKHQFKDAGVKAIIILENFASKLEKILDETSIQYVFTTKIGDFLGFLKKPIVNFVVKVIKKMVPSFSLPNSISINNALKIAKGKTFEKVDTTHSDIAFLQYTGGTTGLSKGAVLTHKNIIANVEQIKAWMGSKLQEKKEKVITALPLYHIFSLTVNCFAMSSIGSLNILVTNPKDFGGFIKELKKHDFSVFTGVNTLFNALLNHPKFSSVNFNHLKITIAGGMALQQAVALEWEKVTGNPILEGYGLTETSPVLCCNPLDGNHQLGTIGMPVPDTEVAILDEQGEHKPLGERGEVCARGPQVMDGYWEKEEESKRVFFSGGWFRTGDIGIMDENGYFRIVDRLKDMILVSGFNVYPNEIEDVIAKHEKVLEVAAIGVPDERSGEVVKLFIVKRDQSLTEEELKAFCKQNFTGYKMPKFIEFRTELPKTNVGKILRRSLKEEVSS